jgi:hypothetical protein
MSAPAAPDLSSKPGQIIMLRSPLLLLPGLAAAVLFLGGALTFRATPPPPAVAVAEGSDAEAVETIDRAIAAWSPERVPWLEAKVWQLIECEDFTFQASGRMVTAPGDRLRYDVNIRVGQTAGELRLVSDGQTVSRSTRVAGEAPQIARTPLPPANDAAARVRCLQEHGFAGVAPMLRILRREMKSARVLRQRWNGHDVQVVSAVWPDSCNPPPSGGEAPSARFRLKQFCVYFDAQSLWPYRIEWWGAEKVDHKNQLLIQTEYRSPVLNQQRGAAEFVLN